jgi:tRNA A37 threonylcarbamoyladenosine modification protein TsaB
VSTAKGLAFALGTKIVGVGRLEVEAHQFVDCGRPVCAIHRAGRGEVAWAVYQGPRDEWREVVAPRLSTPEVLLAEAPADALFCAEEGDGADEMMAAAGARSRSCRSGVSGILAGWPAAPVVRRCRRRGFWRRACRAAIGAEARRVTYRNHRVIRTRARSEIC